MTRAKTTLVKPLWPTVSPAAKGKKTKAGTVKPAEIGCGDELAICDDPPPRTTLGPRTSKYADRFEKMKVGQCLKCSPEKVGTVASAMRAWLQRTGKSDHQAVVSVSDYGDGKGRVWLVAKDKKEKVE